MRLHNNPTEFQELITLAAREKHIPESAVERDYYTVRALLFLSQSEHAEKCVFKCGTSLSKCYPGSIERFSEDIDLTFIPDDGMTNKQIERKLKAIEKLMTADSETEIIPTERNGRNKSIYFWNGNRDSKIKLEIGSSVRPEPYGSKTLMTYIQEYLENHNFSDVISEYELKPVTVNVLNIERSFVDKIMSVKCHAICGTITEKARHENMGRKPVTWFQNDDMEEHVSFGSAPVFLLADSLFRDARAAVRRSCQQFTKSTAGGIDRPNERYCGASENLCVMG